MERIFTNSLKKQLKLRIKGAISVHVIEDIVDGVLPCWRYTIKNLSANLSTGLSSIIVADVIVKQYKKYILSEHFYSK